MKNLKKIIAKNETELKNTKIIKKLLKTVIEDNASTFNSKTGAEFSNAQKSLNKDLKILKMKRTFLKEIKKNGLNIDSIAYNKFNDIRTIENIAKKEILSELEIGGYIYFPVKSYMDIFICPATVKLDEKKFKFIKFDKWDDLDLVMYKYIMDEYLDLMSDFENRLDSLDKNSKKYKKMEKAMKNGKMLKEDYLKLRDLVTNSPEKIKEFLENEHNKSSY